MLEEHRMKNNVIKNLLIIPTAIRQSENGNVLLHFLDMENKLFASVPPKSKSLQITTSPKTP